MYSCIKDRVIDVRLYFIEDFNEVQVTCGKKSNSPQLPGLATSNHPETVKKVIGYSSILQRHVEEKEPHLGLLNRFSRSRQEETELD